MDELVAYIRQFEEGRQYVGGSFGANVTFIQSLTEAIKGVSNAILLASLPESEAEAGGALGERALDTLSKYFGRVEAVWKPVGTEEAFNIVRRRLFARVDDLAAEKNCEAFFQLYREQADHFPVDTQKGAYLQRLKQAFPIHPELFDQLYDEWSTLDRFQRTRGVLQLMALTVHALWQDDNRDAMILPGSMPLADTNVRNKLISYLPGQGWDPIVERDVDGPRSEPVEIDRDSRFGQIQAARRVSRTIFMGSAPSVEHTGVRGVDVRQIALGVAQPGQPVPTYRDALKRLGDRLHYLNSAEERFWFSKRPNLRREMEERKRAIKFDEEVVPELRRRVDRIFGNQQVFSGVHVFADSADVPDDFDLRLVVLPPNLGFSRTVDNRAVPEAERILKTRGEKPRQRQNRILFLAADLESSRRMTDQATSYLAWRGMGQAVKEDRLVLDQLQSRQVRESTDKAEEALKRAVRESYRWLLAPFQALDRNGRPSKLEWEARSLQAAAPSISQEMERVLRQEEDVIFDWSPVHLRAALQQWFWQEDKSHVSSLEVWHAMCDYLYLPRLKSSLVLEQAIREGAESTDFFGYATAVNNQKYEGFVFGRSVTVHLDAESVLIEPGVALAWQDRSSEKNQGSPTNAANIETDPADSTVGASTQSETTKAAQPETLKTRFFGTVELDPVRAQLQFAEIQRELIHHLQTAANAKVRIRVDIEAENPDGYGEKEVRTIRENASALGFGESDFGAD
jgi:predicted AAA+ superfamily ATPase